MQRTYVEEALENINQEAARVEYQLIVACFAARRNMVIATNLSQIARDTHDVGIEDTVLIMNKYHVEE